MKTINFKFVCLLCYCMFSLMSVYASSDSELIMSRIRSKLRPNMTTVENVVATYLPTMQANGSWSDINYQDFHHLDGWEPAKHYDRLLAFAQAYVLDSKYKDDSTLHTAIKNGLTYYYQVKPKSENWWDNELRAPQLILATFIYLRAGKASVLSTLESNFLTRFDSLPEPTKHGLGANRSDVALWHLYQAVLRDNANQLIYASEQLFNSLVTTTSDGIQHDYNYMDHGPQLYTYAYGCVVVNNSNQAAKYLTGTSYAISDNYLSVYANFLKSGYSTCLRGKYVSFNTLGRSISRPNSVQKDAWAFREALTVDPANSDFYQSVLDRAQGIIPLDSGVTPTFTHYYRSKFSTHNRGKYYFTVLTVSNRTEKPETGRGENLKGLFLGDGATNILVNGDEYFNIFPVWDWTKIPGVTVPEYTNLKPPREYGVLGTSTFTGGVSNGKYGAHVFAMNDYNTQAKKAWFCFDDEIVCLGAGISSSAEEKINTTVNQCVLDGTVTVSSNEVTSDLVAGSTQTYTNNIDWVLHDGVGYFFPQGGNIKLTNQTQNGSWKSINNLRSSQAVSKGVFKLWFTHGVKPEDDSYAYIVAPGITSSDAMQAYNQNAIEILSNTKEIQAVKHAELDMIQVIFYKAGSLTSEGCTIQTDKPCAMVLSDVSTSKVKLNIADPSETSSDIRIDFKSDKIEGMRQIVCVMPTSVETAGKSVAKVIDENTPSTPDNDDIITNEDLIKNINVILYPNPATEWVYLSNVPEGTDIKIYSLIGQLVKQGKYHSGINVSQLQNGLYMCVFNIDGNLISYKVLKQ
ncbi:T9SS type A sorting domain-containing protein [Puteibacter caeruleilacunae]|nr:T9SS type A sorting domain-containing protein [Puteibacter caeruleilacunae]